ncbi:MAG: bifunctional pyr operon transcriptional regulator/uracil phosphoribosyltransferase [Candidatus Firestonebacteria bacterium RIFOXYC2_FULL_39_67]|nr:MAG: bifunctional pyr operon transcriptional regulator/uracil phosphoribosyltransferase [Candidatus Firestonebacteria bacterium RIFOXYD2_FULL_39_29]OGF54218.1 MAG: bifunctional pyr operon transcriptional regulator/uracil phosphoribosyltransferase [Candidatus Firestonebacteria bacterium RIFOXYC2_FULL_39_67]
MSKKIMDKDGLGKTLARLAHEVIEKNDNLDEIALVGIRSRGDHIAARIASRIEKISGKTIPVGAIDITFYRDDVGLKIAKDAQPTDVKFSIDGKNIILVDDVLYTGRSTRAAIDALLDLGRPKKIQLLVLIDRGHKQLPIHADYVGKNIPTSFKEVVEIRLTEQDSEDSITLV